MLKNVFAISKVIPELSYKPKAIAKNHHLIDFLHGIHPSSPGDMQALESWSGWFRAKKVPFAVVRERSGLLVLWKVDEADDDTTA